MFPYDRKEKKPRTSIFGDFEGFFADLDNMAQKMMENAGQNSFVYGYETHTGPDGKPVTREFSNVPDFKGLGSGCSSFSPQLGAPAQEESATDPYCDVLDEGETVKIIVDMPGVEKTDIKVQAAGRRVTVDAAGNNRTYKKSIDLPDHVASKPTKAQYKNGILELTYGKHDEPADIEVE